MAHVQRAFYIRRYVTAGAFVGKRDRDKSCQMKDDIHALSNVEAKMRVADITRDNPYVVQARQSFQPAPIVERVILRKRMDSVSGMRQAFNQVRADKPVRTGYKDSFHRDVVAGSLP